MQNIGILFYFREKIDFCLWCAYSVLVGRHGGMRSLVSHRCRWEDTIKVDLKGVRWGSLDWIELALGRERWRVFVNRIINL